MNVIEKYPMYVIKEFGSLNIDQQIEILKCFVNHNEVLLFQNFKSNIDIMDNDTKTLLKESYYEDYCLDIIYFYDKSLKNQLDNKIKNILTSNLENISFKKNIQDQEQFEDQILYSLRNGDITVDHSTLDKIKDEILQTSFKNEDPIFAEFVKERTKYTNTTWLCEDGIGRGGKEVIWYIPRSSQEIKYIMKTQVFYACIIINKVEIFDKFSLGIVYFETAEGYNLVIIEKKEGSFTHNILPKIMEVNDKITINKI